MVVDLGSGGGLPGLPLIDRRPDLSWVLVDAMKKRCDWLVTAVSTLGAQADVRHERAEETGRSSLRERADVVVARLFGRPAVAAECASPLLRVGGSLWVAEPPGSPDRWPAEHLAALGLVLSGRKVGSWIELAKTTPCPDRFPRRVGIPRKRPLF